MIPEPQLQLQLPDLAYPEYAKASTIEERFDQFHKANPHVFYALRDLALDLVRKGHSKIGMKMLFEVLRWSAMRTRGDDSYKLNNNYTSRYARLFADTYPELAEVFEMRKLKTK